MLVSAQAAVFSVFSHCKHKRVVGGGQVGKKAGQESDMSQNVSPHNPY